MGRASASGLADITIASVLTMVSQERMHKFNPARFKLILIDEVHHAATPSYMRILQHFSAMSPESKVIVIGFSATIFRLDGLKLGVAIDHIAYHQSLVDLIEQKWYDPERFFAADSLTGSRTSASQYARALIGRKPGKSGATRAIGKTGETGETRIITSKTPKSERLRLLEDFGRQEYPVLVNCGILTEGLCRGSTGDQGLYGAGTNIPNIDCVLLARPTKSHNLFLQMIGRGMRLFPGKSDCHVIDMVGNVSHGILAVPTLFGLDPKEINKEASQGELRRISGSKEKTKSLKHSEGRKSSCLQVSRASPNIKYVEWDFTHDFIKDFELVANVRKFSKLPWIHIKDNKYILSIPIFGFIKVDKDIETGKYLVNLIYKLNSLDAYYASETLRVPGSSAKSHTHKKHRVILSNAISLRNAIFAVDTYVMRNYPRRMVLKNATWRKSPATSTQIALINKINPSINRNINNMTKGLAWDLITKLTHGAKVFSKQTKPTN
ncbi:unnamed protein product [Pneumocystis jirovecii]|uniref:Helicase C-terminal domain-containing protein n=1 Tax=Pneumocystis jirovecii TaxID=42068 RepID=L0PD20_PNEJI|nr:unnamed protein product [Pneumocystis jirovecii]